MILWIASYPKSGNTWVRSFLISYINNSNKPFEFDDLDKIKTFPGNNEINFLRNKCGGFRLVDMAANWNFFQTQINKNKKINYLKTHNALCTLNNLDFTDKNNTIGVIYVVRDPRDVVISYSNHLKLNLDQTFNLMNNELFIEKTNDLLPRTLLGKWSQHFNSWKNFNGVKKIFVRYEDLIDDPELNFYKIVKYLNGISGLEVNKEQINKSINDVSFSRLSKLEGKLGFIENPNDRMINFFRVGKKNQWKTELPDTLRRKIENEFQKELVELKYK